MSSFRYQTMKQLSALEGTGRQIKWYFSEKNAADYVRKQLGIPSVTIGYMPPRR